MKTLLRLALLMLLAPIGFVGSGAMGSASVCAAESSGPQATILIRGESGKESLECVTLSKDRANGIEALKSSGHKVQTKEFGGVLGAAVCSIDGVGNPLSDCPGSSGHWHYWLWNGSGWIESHVGPSSTEVTEGSVQGWTWAAGNESPPPRNNNPEASCTSSQKLSAQQMSSANRPWIYLAAFAFLLIPGIVIRLRKRSGP